MDLVVGSAMLAAMYALVAFAWIIMFRTTGILNLATGTHMAIGAYIFDTLSTRWDLPWIVAVAGWLGTTLAIAWLTQYGLFRKLAGQPEFVLVVATIGLASLLRGLTSMTWGTGSRVMKEPFTDQLFQLPENPSLLGCGIHRINAMHICLDAFG